MLRYDRIVFRYVMVGARYDGIAVRDYGYWLGLDMVTVRYNEVVVRQRKAQITKLDLIDFTYFQISKHDSLLPAEVSYS